MVSEEEAKRYIDLLGITDRSVEEIQATLYSECLKLFSVENTGGNGCYVLAEDSNLARVIALREGLVRAKGNARVRELGERFFAANPAFGSAVKRAIAEGKPGLVRRHADHAIVAGVTYPPLHAV